MCYITSKDEKIKTADRDIVVYKLLSKYNDEYRAAFYGSFSYEEGKEYETVIKEGENYVSFDKQDTENIRAIPKEERVSYGSGFHSCEMEDRINVMVDNECIGMFFIPKGAEYMYRDGLYISNRIRFVGEV